MDTHQAKDSAKNNDDEHTMGILQLRDEPSEEDMEKYLPQLRSYSQR